LLKNRFDLGIRVWIEIGLGMEMGMTPCRSGLAVFLVARYCAEVTLRKGQMGLAQRVCYLLSMRLGVLETKAAIAAGGGNDVEISVYVGSDIAHDEAPLDVRSPGEVAPQGR
jgi:hypothetical protein